MALVEDQLLGIKKMDADGSYIGIADLASAAFAVGIRDPNWQ